MWLDKKLLALLSSLYLRFSNYELYRHKKTLRKILRELLLFLKINERRIKLILNFRIVWLNYFANRNKNKLFFI